MKQQYKNPEVKVIKIDSSSIVCVSSSFGDGDTNVMHAKEYIDILGDEEDSNDEE